MRKIIRRKDYSYELSIFEGTPEKIKQTIDEIASKYSSDIKFELHEYGYDGGVDLCVVYDDYETDKEYVGRLEFEKSMEEHKKRKLKEEEQEERELYETLKKKYEQNI